MINFKTFKLVAAVLVVFSIASCKPIGQVFDDNSAPTTPSISINSGASTTNSTSVTLTLSAVDATSMYVTNTAGCASGGNYEAYATSKAWTLGTSNGTATVYVKFRDRAGNETSCSSDSITHDSVAPTVSSVNSSTTNGSFKAAGVISIQVNFSEAVTVVTTNGTPTLTLETGATDRAVNYASGSGTSALTFTYTVQAGDTSSDLDYVATTSLALNSGTIKDAAGNNATLTLASPGAANSLGANKSLVVDTTAPTVSSFSSSTANGTYNAGDTINITATASENVTAGATFIATLNSGATVTLTAASLGTTLTGTYTVAAGQNSSDLSVSSFAAGTVLDVAGNQLTSTTVPSSPNNIGDAKNIVVDTTAPTIVSFSSSTSSGVYKVGDTINITATASENVQSGATFVVTLDTTATVTLTAAAVGTTLTGTYTVAAGQTSADLTVSSFTAGTVLDAVGNQLTSTTVPLSPNNIADTKSIVVDTTAPTIVSFSSSKSNGAYKEGDTINITATASENVQSGATFVVTLDTTANVTLTAAAVGTTLTGTYTVAAGQTSADLTVSSFTAGTVLDAVGNQLTSTTVPSSPNNIGDAKNIVVDTTAPTIVSFSSSTTDGTYNAGDTINIRATASENVQSGATFVVTLDTTATVTLTAAAVGTTLEGTYTVAAGQTSADLTVSSFTAGTVLDVAGNQLTSTTVPSSPNNIGDAKNIVVDTTAPTIVSFSSSTANGTYKVGDPINITATASENVQSGATFVVTLDTTATVTLAAAAVGTTLTGTYTVAAGQTSADLTVSSFTAGTVLDAVGNQLTSTTVPLSPNNIADTKSIVVDTTAPTIVSFSSSTSNGAYKVGDTINITATASENVTAGATFIATLNSGATVTLTAASLGTTLTGTYTVAAGQNSSDLSVSSFTAGAVLDVGGTQMTSTAVPASPNNIGDVKNIVVDTTAPTIVSFSSSKSNGAYKEGDTINITATASENVQSGATFVVTLDTTANVTLTAAAVGTTLTGTYTVAAGQTSADLTVSSFTAGTVLDAVGNQLTSTTVPSSPNNLADNKNIIIDTTAPSVPSISINNGDPSTNSSLVDLTLSAVGASQMCITNTAGCPCPNPGDWESYGTSKLAHVLGQSSGTATVYAKFRDAALNESACVNDTIENSPRVTNVTSSSLNGIYTQGETISIQVTFESAVTVTGTPTLTLETGSSDAVVTYTSGSGSTTLTFDYTVAAGHNTSDLSYVNTSSLALAGGTITAGGINANLNLPTVGASGSLSFNKSIVVDTVPVVTNVTSTKANGTYNIGESIPIQVVFSEPVTVSGAVPQLTLETGTNDAVVSYNSGTGSNTLVFNYVVAASENSSDLDYKNTSALSLNGATIRDADGDNALLTLVAPGAATSLGANKAIVVSTPPVVENVTSSTPNGTYTAGQSISIQVVFNKSVTVTASPSANLPLLELETGTTDRSATCAAGSGTSVTCTYTVQPGDTSSDLNYTSTGALTLNGGSIKDTANDTLIETLTLPGLAAAGSLGTNKNLVIDPVPSVTNVTSSNANGTYAAGEVIGVQVVFSEAVTVDITGGTPQLTLTTSSGTTAVNYVSGSGTNTLLFNYTIAAGDYFSDLDYAATTSLALNGGIIESTGTPGQNAVLTLASPGAATSLGANKAIRSVFYASQSGTVNNESFGSQLATGDVNGDGHPDVVLGIPFANSNDGRVIVYSGDPAVTFGSTVLMDIAGAAGDGDNFGASVSTADVDDDGKSEVIVGAPLYDDGATLDVGKASVYDYDAGNSNPPSLIDQIGTEADGNFGSAVAGVGDLNGDGYDDVVVGIPYAAIVGGGVERGQVKVYSGTDGALMATLSSSEDNARFGAYLAATGDVNGDGTPDFIASAPTAAGAGTQRGRVRVYSGASFTVLYNYYGSSNNDQWGSSLAGGVDITGDNVPDFMIGSRFVDPSVGATDRGQVIVYNGATGVAIPGYTYTGSANSEGLGASIDFVGNANSDTRKAFVIGSPNAQVGGTAKGKAVVYDGSDGSTVLHTLEGSETGEEFGSKIVGLRDSIENDSRNDFVIASPGADAGGTDRGKISVYR